MVNKLYPKARERFLNGGISYSADVIKLVIVDLEDYTYGDEHEFLSDIPTEARISISPALTGKTSVNGVAKANNPTFTAVSGDSGEALVVFKDTGNPSTSPLIAYIDNNGALTLTPNGQDVPVLFNADGIFNIGGECGE